MWKKYYKISEIAALWDEKVAAGYVCLDSRLIEVAEDYSGDSQFRYFVKYEKSIPVAVFMVMIAQDTPFYGIEGLEGKSYMTAVTGTNETTGAHFWFDSGRMTAKEFVNEALEQIRGLGDEFEVIAFRDFIEPEGAGFRDAFMIAGFTEAEAMTVSKLTVPQESDSLEAFISTLKYKYRYQLGIYRGALDREKYEVEIREDFPLILDELYPLYLDVCSRAEEYQAEPYPEGYFHRIKEVFGPDAVAVTIKEGEKYLGFMLLLYTFRSCVHQYIGFKKVDDLYLWHNLTIESIGDAVSRGVRDINMGVTNSVAKHKFGARSFRNYMYVKFR